MRGFSLLISPFSLLAVFALILCACMDDINNFLEGEDVQRVIANTRVGLVDKTGDGLRVGNGSISGLNPNKYYLVYVEDENNAAFVTHYRYVSRDGSLSNAIGDIGRASGGIMLGLDNELTYTVWAATPLTGLMTPFIDNVEQANKINATASGITLPKTLDSQTLGLPANAKVGTVYARVPIGYEDRPDEYPTNSATFLPTLRIKLWEAGTTVDYVFHDNIEKEIFTFLRVVISSDTPNTDPSPMEDGLNVTINKPELTDAEIEFDIGENAYTVSQTDLTEAEEAGTLDDTLLPTISVDMVNGVSSGFTQTWHWVENNNGVLTNESGSTLDLYYIFANNINYWAKGAHKFTVVIKIGTKDYSAYFTVTVTE